MQHQVIRVAEHPAGKRSRTWARDLAVAMAVATALSIGWAMHEWRMLSHLLLPDPDDMMRLAQVRDWLGGQATNDWTQYRMAPPLGSPMHWSRINDVGIAALILAFSFFTDQRSAELVAVLVYPATLFCCYLFLSARIARRIWGAEAALIAAVLGAVAFPGTTIFVPGRIDHHALQVVLLELAILFALHRASVRSGLLIGGTVAVGLAVGLEAVPQTAALLAAVFAFWVFGPPAERRRLMGLAIGLTSVTAAILAFLRPTLWSTALCDAFTPATANATLAGGIALGLLAAATPRLRDWKARLTAGAILGAGVIVWMASLYPACLHGPYGQVNPFLRREFFVHIDEANGPLRQRLPAHAIQLVGLMSVSMIGVFWTVRRYPARWRRWGPVAAVIVTSGVISLVQVRGTYVGAPAGAALLAGAVLAARRAGRPGLLVAVWLLCAGVTWQVVPTLASAAVARPSPPSAANGALLTLCNTPGAWEAMNRYPAGVVMAPTSVAAFLMASTHMSTVGAGYHRNDAGNMAMYSYFLSRPERARMIARRWNVRYVAFCPGDFNEMGAHERFPNSVATMLNDGRAPADFQRLPLRSTRLRLYRIVP